MNYLDDFKIIYPKAITLTKQRISSNPLVLLLPLLYSILIAVASQIGSYLNLGLLTGFLIPVLYSLVLSSFFEQLSDLHFYNKIGLGNLKDSFIRNFSSIYSVYFILIIINYFSVSLGILAIFIMIIMYFTLNAISETIYIKGESYTSAYSSTVEFMNENVVQWMIPQLIYLSIVYVVLGFDFGEIINAIFRGVMEINLGITINLNEIFSAMNIQYIIKLLIIEIITGINVVFRGALFGILSGSTMRKRKYMGVL